MKGRMTALHFCDVYRHVVSNSTRYPMSVVSSIMQYGQGIDHVPAVRWTKENEDHTRKEYVTQVKT